MTDKSWRKKREIKTVRETSGYGDLLKEVSGYLAEARKSSVRAVNSVMTATYWLIGRRIVEFEQGGKDRAAYGEALLARLSEDLTAKFGRGFSKRNLEQMRLFYLGWEICQTSSGIFELHAKCSTVLSESNRHTHDGVPPIAQTVSAQSKCETLSGKSLCEISSTSSRNSHLLKRATPSLKSSLSSDNATPPIRQTPSAKSPGLGDIAKCFLLPWSHYVRLLSVENPKARAFYEAEALRGGWSVRQLDRQISTLFYERTALSRNKKAMLEKGGKAKPQDAVSPEEEIKDPYVLEFLGLKDEYSENELEEALVRNLENFLLELGGDFAFVGRQRRLRVGDEWYRVDLLFFHRKLRCLVVIDLKLGKFSHADAGQMHLYLNYERKHWVREGENPPVGLILCAQRDETVARYALEGLPNKVMTADYRLALPDVDILAREIQRSQGLLESRALYRA